MPVYNQIRNFPQPDPFAPKPEELAAAPVEIIVEISEGDDGPQMQDDGTMQIPLPDGNVMIDYEPETDPIGDGIEHRANLADHLKEWELASIASHLMEGIEQDDDSRKQWLQERANGMDLLGLKIQSPRADIGNSSAPLEGMSSVRHPLMAEAVFRFQSNAFGELCPANGPAKVVNYSDQTLEHDDLSDALERDLNYYLTTTAKEYYDSTDKMLFWVGYGGMGFKKVYFCPIRNRPVSDFVDAKDVIVSNYVPNLENASRVTHEITMKRSVLKRMQMLGVYRDLELGMPEQEADAVDRKVALLQGVKPIADRPEDQDYQLYECYCELDIQGFEHRDDEGDVTGLPLPYKVTIEKTSRQILEIRRNWDEDDEDYTPIIPFVSFEYIRGPGFYAIGLLQLLGNTTNAITAAWRVMLDSGMFSNFPGFLYLKAAGRQVTNEFRVPPGGGMGIDASGATSIRDAVMPLPYKEPGAALMQLVENIAMQGQRLGGTAELPTGEGRQDAPVGTTLALIEQATKVESAVHRRLHQAQDKELQLMVDLFRRNPESLFMGNKRSYLQRNVDMTLMALENYDIVPRSDPNVPSRMHRLAKVAALKQLQAMNPLLYNGQAVDTVCLNEIGIQNPESLFAPPQQAMPDPIKMRELALKAKDLNIKEAKTMADIVNEAANRKSKEDLATMELAERIATHPESYGLVQQTLSNPAMPANRLN
jgi:hypothetical protein